MRIPYTEYMRLSSLSGQHRQFLLLGLDQPMVLAQQLGLTLNTPEDRQQLEGIFQEIVNAYSSLTTGLVLTAELGYSALNKKSDGAGVVFCLERTLSEIDPLSIPILQTNWNIEAIRNNFALAKLALYAHAQEEELITKLELVNELSDSCRYEGIDFMLELRVVDGSRASDDDFQEQQLRLIRLFRTQAEALVLEYPRTALGCLSVTAQAQMPWIVVLPQKDTYVEAKEKLRNALTGGASGLVVGSLVLPSFKRGEFSLDALRAFLQKEGRDRLVELGRICAETVGTGG